MNKNKGLCGNRVYGLSGKRMIGVVNKYILLFC